MTLSFSRMLRILMILLVVAEGVVISVLVLVVKVEVRGLAMNFVETEHAYRNVAYLVV